MNCLKALSTYESDQPFVREVACFATEEHGVISLTTNNCGGGVAFDFFTIKDFLFAQEIKPKYLVMIHSHPDGCDGMSTIDKNMVRGWCLAFGLPILYIIISKDAIIEYECIYVKRTKDFICDQFVNTTSHWNLLADGRWSMGFSLISSVIYGLSVVKEDITKPEQEAMTIELQESGLKPCLTEL